MLISVSMVMLNPVCDVFRVAELPHASQCCAWVSCERRGGPTWGREESDTQGETDEVRGGIRTKNQPDFPSCEQHHLILSLQVRTGRSSWWSLKTDPNPNSRSAAARLQVTNTSVQRWGELRTLGSPDRHSSRSGSDQLGTIIWIILSKSDEIQNPSRPRLTERLFVQNTSVL